MTSNTNNSGPAGPRTQSGLHEVDAYLGEDKQKVSLWKANAFAALQTKSLRRAITNRLNPTAIERIPRVARRHLDCLLKFVRENDSHFKSILDGDYSSDCVDDGTVPVPLTVQPTPIVPVGEQEDGDEPLFPSEYVVDPIYDAPWDVSWF
jgi:hypothetical protein